MGQKLHYQETIGLFDNSFKIWYHLSIESSANYLIFAIVKNLAYILSFVFVSFLFTPSVIALVDSTVDISIAFKVNEEESSSKNQITFEYTIEEMDSNYESIHFLQIRKLDGHYYKENMYNVFLSVTSPPPKKA